MLREAKRVPKGERVRPYIPDVFQVQRQREPAKVAPHIGIRHEIVALRDVQQLPDAQRRFADIT